MLNLNFEATGTTWKIDVYSETVTGNLEKSIQDLITDFENTYSRFKPTSLITKISTLPNDYTLPLSAKPLFDIYQNLEQLTNGAFTPLIGKNLVEAGYDSTYSFSPKDSLSANIRFGATFEYDFPHLKVKTPVALDFGAAGKGYLMDLIAELLKGSGFFTYSIDAGHDYVISSSHKPVRIGLENPMDAQSAIGVVEIKSGSICGSSGNRRNWGKYNHIINGNSLESAKDILATWVIADTGLVADAISTAIFFVDPVLIKEHYQFQYVILYSDYSVNVSDNFSGELFNA